MGHALSLDDRIPKWTTQQTTPDETTAVSGHRSAADTSGWTGAAGLRLASGDGQWHPEVTDGLLDGARRAARAIPGVTDMKSRDQGTRSVRATSSPRPD